MMMLIKDDDGIQDNLTAEVMAWGGHTVKLTVIDDRRTRMENLRRLVNRLNTFSTFKDGPPISAITHIGLGRLRVNWAKMPNSAQLKRQHGWPDDCEIEHYYDGQPIPYRW
jgi:hypothetical protein